MRLARRVGTVVALVVAPACATDTARVIVHTAGGPRAVAVEVVDTPGARNRGLMYRRQLADGAGMLFVFDEEADHGFWMKNTFIPLDMIFVGSDRRVAGVHADARPHSLDQIRIGRPSRWVVEVPAGWTARAGVAVGDRVELPPSVEIDRGAY